MKPLISVIIPHYNRLELLAEALDSVSRQTWKPLEVLLVDDGSPGHCRPGLKALKSDHPWQMPGRGLELICLDHSGFPGLVRNRGLEQARGDYLAFLDSDDLWLPHKLETQWQCLHEAQVQNSLISLCHSREKWLRRGKEISQKNFRHQREGWVFPDALEKCIIGPSTVLVSREGWERLGPFREDLEVAEDYELWLRWTSAEPVAYCDEALTIKRAGEWEQLSEKYGQIEIFRIRALEEWLLGLPQVLGRKSQEDASQNHQVLAGQVLARKMEIYAQGAAKRGRNDEAAFYRDRARHWKEKFI